jgi:hypothetical protein
MLGEHHLFLKRRFVGGLWLFNLDVLSCPEMFGWLVAFLVLVRVARHECGVLS